MKFQRLFTTSLCLCICTYPYVFVYVPGTSIVGFVFVSLSLRLCVCTRVPGPANGCPIVKEKCGGGKSSCSRSPHEHTFVDDIADADPDVVGVSEGTAVFLLRLTVQRRDLATWREGWRRVVTRDVKEWSDGHVLGGA